MSSLLRTSTGLRLSQRSRCVSTWTPERLASARVVDLRAGLTPLEVESFAAEPSVATEGARPTVAVIPNNRNLLLNPSTVPAYEEETMAGEEIQPAAYGTSGLRYTNSRNVPFAASTDNALPYRTIGKWFFTKPGAGNFVCSASVIGRRIVVTAGHCLHSGNGSGTGWFSNFLFVPSYRAGAAPFGYGRAGNARSRPLGSMAAVRSPMRRTTACAT